MVKSNQQHMVNFGNKNDRAIRKEINATSENYDSRVGMYL